MKSKTNIVEEPLADYKKAEEDLLRKALSSSYTERFHTMARLMKMNVMLKSTKVIHKKNGLNNKRVIARYEAVS